METTNERRWNSGSTIAAGFALFFFLYQMAMTIISTTLPTDGWQANGNLEVKVPSLVLEQYFLDGPTPLQAKDQVTAINGVPVQQIVDAGHVFFRMTPPAWKDGSVLKYDLLRNGERLTVDVPVHIYSFWDYQVKSLRMQDTAGIVQTISSLFFFLVGLVVFLLRPGNRAAHALLLVGTTFFFNPISGNYTIPTLFYPSPPVSIPFDGWTLMINPSMMYLALAFPRPKAPLRRYPHLTVGLLYLTWPILLNTAYLLNLYNRAGYLKIAFAIYPIQVVLLMLITIGSLLHTALTVRDPVGRSQFKWMVAGIFSFVFIGVGGWLVSSYFYPQTMTSGNWLLTIVGWFLLPICLAIAILRYRLFDIDVIIRKTIIYSVVTGLLALIYFGGVLLLQKLFTSIGSANSPAAIVISTLLSAVLFSPVRKRVQMGVDHRFYRRKYDAQKTLEKFAVQARDEVELEKLSTHLLGAVQETVQPEGASLWIRK